MYVCMYVCMVAKPIKGSSILSFIEKLSIDEYTLSSLMNY